MTKKQRQEQIQGRIGAAILTASVVVGIVLTIAGIERVMADEVPPGPVAGFALHQFEMADAVIETEEVEIVAEPDYSFDEQYLLATLIYAEAGACKSDTTLGYVGSVVLNRVDSGFYPNDIYSVIYDRHWGIQYACAFNGGMNKKPDDRCLEIAGELLEMWYETGETLLPGNVLGQAGFVTLHGEYTRSEGIIFSFY